MIPERSPSPDTTRKTAEMLQQALGNIGIKGRMKEAPDNGIQYGRSYLKPIDEPFRFRSMYTIGTEEQVILDNLWVSYNKILKDPYNKQRREHFMTSLNCCSYQFAKIKEARKENYPYYVLIEGQKYIINF